MNTEIIKHSGSENQEEMLNIVVDFSIKDDKINREVSKRLFRRMSGFINNRPLKAEEQDYFINELGLKKYRQRKLEGLRLQWAYEQIGNKVMEGKAIRVNICSTHLKFWIGKNKKKKLVRANFCRDRLCPQCAYRRSLKLYVENKKCFDKLTNKGRFLFLTLTCKNVFGENLKEEITRCFDGYRKLVSRKCIKPYLLGAVRALEVTYNKIDNTYHPHIHVLLHVNDNYFSRGYMNHREWRQNWKEVMELDYEPQVDIRVFRSKTEGKQVGRELAEISKYCVKFNDIMGLNNEQFLNSVKVLDSSLYGRRLIAFTGTFRKVRREMKFTEDIADEAGSEIGVDDILPDDEGYIIISKWSAVDKKYINRIEKTIFKNHEKII